MRVQLFFSLALLANAASAAQMVSSMEAVTDAVEDRSYVGGPAAVARSVFKRETESAAPQLVAREPEPEPQQRQRTSDIDEELPRVWGY